MLNSIYLKFCEDLKNISLNNKGEKILIISCDHIQNNSLLTSPSIRNYDDVVLIFKKIYGENYDYKLENSKDNYKDCKEIYLHLVIK